MQNAVSVQEGGGEMGEVVVCIDEISPLRNNRKIFVSAREHRHANAFLINLSPPHEEAGGEVGKM